MQRVLSFQTARGFGESSEFITKRMCFSFLFSVGFLCILCGFLVGRFAAGRVNDIRAEKTRLRLAGNGLENTQHLREALIRQLDENSFSTSYVNNDEIKNDVERLKEALLDLHFFRSVDGNHSCIVATILGSHEPDRYVVLSGSDEGVTIILELSKALKKLSTDFEWQPRRSLKFMVSFENSDAACQTFLPARTRSKVVAYMALNVPTQFIEESGHFVIAGSDIVQSILLQAGADFKNPNYKNNLGDSPTIIEACGATSCSAPRIPRLRLDIPNAALTFVIEGNASRTDESPKNINAYRRAMARIVGTGLWKLSEMTLFRWNPRVVLTALIDNLESLNLTEHEKIINLISVEARKTIIEFNKFNERIDQMETANSLKVRIANDLSMEVRRILLCSDDDLRSRSDWSTLRDIIVNSSVVGETLRKLFICYENANRALREDAT